MQTKSGNSKEKHQTQISEQAYRKHVCYILRQGQYEDNDDFDWEGEPAYIEKLDEVLEAAV